MINMKQFRDHVMVPILRLYGLNSPSAVELLMHTIAQESQGQHLCQIGGGPARGLYQMEVDTLHDLLNQLRQYHPKKWSQLTGCCGRDIEACDALTWNLGYQTLACRLQYWRYPQALPDLGDVDGMWHYYKTYWNTPKGAATRTEFDRNWQRMEKELN